mmetsp:Transcript_41610/g.120645  ORF Transcript_41610/g.120645 Transcript_41610/m.120645 type:complete len:259 (-) Transcript_41610:343-1119(-)
MAQAQGASRLWAVGRPVVAHALRRSAAILCCEQLEALAVGGFLPRRQARMGCCVVRAWPAAGIVVGRQRDVEEGEVLDHHELVQIVEHRLKPEIRRLRTHDVVHVKRGQKPSFKEGLLRCIYRQPNLPEEETAEDKHVRVVVHRNLRALAGDKDPDRCLRAEVDPHETHRHRVILQAEGILLRDHSEVLRADLVEQRVHHLHELGVANDALVPQQHRRGASDEVEQCPHWANVRHRHARWHCVGERPHGLGGRVSRLR